MTQPLGTLVRSLCVGTPSLERLETTKCFKGLPVCVDWADIQKQGVVTQLTRHEDHWGAFLSENSRKKGAGVFSSENSRKKGAGGKKGNKSCGSTNERC